MEDIKNIEESIESIVKYCGETPCHYCVMHYICDNYFSDAPIEWINNFGEIRK